MLVHQNLQLFNEDSETSPGLGVPTSCHGNPKRERGMQCVRFYFSLTLRVTSLRGLVSELALNDAAIVLRSERSRPA